MQGMDELVGRELGPYRLEEQIGVGGMAVVYRAMHLDLRQRRAIKVLPRYLASDARFVDRFRREATIAADLKHPNIAFIYDVDEEDGLHYVVMDLVEGRSLRELLRAEGALPLERAFAILRQIADAVDYAHARGRVHRDLRPENVLVDADDRLKVVDFGIAGAAEATGITPATALVGTVAYVAPEALAGGGGRGADLYAVGVIAYELLTGRPPFQGNNPVAVAHALAQEPPPPPRQFRPDLSEAREAVLLRQLAKAPALRFARAGELVDALVADRPPPPPLADEVPTPLAISLESERPTVADEGETRAIPPAAVAPPPVVADASDHGGLRRLLGPGLVLVALVGTGLIVFFSVRSSEPAEPGAARPTSTTVVVSQSAPAAPPAPATEPPPAATAVPTVPSKPTVPAATAPPPAPTAPAPTPAPVAAVPKVPIPEPLPKPTASPPPRVVLDESFNTVRPGWPNDRQGTAAFGDGGYRLVARQSDRFVAVGAPLERRLRDVVVSGTFRKVGGPSGGGYGLIVRDQGPGPRDGVSQGGRYYVFEVSDLGEWGAWRREETRWVDLQPWAASPAVRRGNEPNELRLEALGARFRFLCNGVELATLEDPTLPEGGVGVYLGGDLNEVLVTRFVVAE